jgi:hypothetical protein
VAVEKETVAVFVFVAVAIVALATVEPVVVHLGLECYEYAVVDLYMVDAEIVVVAVVETAEYVATE